MTDQVKEQVLKYLEDATIGLDLFGEWKESQLKELTAGHLASKLGVSRNLISHYFNEFHHDGLVVKVNSRPVYFFHMQSLCEYFHTKADMRTYDTLDELRKNLLHNAHHSSAFHDLVGANESLSYCIEQCKAAITYPNGGLPVLLQGPTGTGKSLIARLMYDYGVEKEIIDKNGKFVHINCAEFTNNPEMLMTNLFGYKKGAYTGADKDTQGLIALAEGGVLFLDEVHGLKPECQEKIFLFMDKGIYHMVGDNETWHEGKVRLIFATTENPDEVLLKTLLRRIPILVKIPPLSDRPLQEKKELIHHVVSKEMEHIGRNVKLSKLAYQILETAAYPGNVGELKNCIRASVAKAFLRASNKDEEVELHLFDLPGTMIAAQSENETLAEYDDRTMLSVSDILNATRTESTLYLLNQQFLRLFTMIPHNEAGMEEFIHSTYSKIEPYIDYLFFNEQTQNLPKFKLLNNLLTSIFNILAHKYNIDQLSNNEISIMTYFVMDYTQNFTGRQALLKQYKKECSEFMDLMQDYYIMDDKVIMDTVQLLEDALDTKFDYLGSLDLFLFFHYFDRDQGRAAIPAVIIAHGYSIASSIAETANQLLQRRIFDAIDMPIESDFEVVVKKLREYLSRLPGCKEVVVMVDMGSLQEIYKHLENIKDMNIGVINNVTTMLALDIGTMILENDPISYILREASERNQHNFVIVENRHKPDVILSVCETGIGTAEKISELIGSSLPASSDITIVPYDYRSLKEMGTKSPVFEKYHVLFIVGTCDPEVYDMPFISIEELIQQKSTDKTDEVFADYLTKDELMQFNKDMIKNFSLDNLLNYLTILDSEKIINSVEEIIREIQNDLNLHLDSGIVLGLYIHISCLIERLIIDKYITKFDHLEEFIRDHQDFIQVVKKAFVKVESCYNVEIPVSEIGYLYEYIYNRNRHSVNEEADSVNGLWEI